MRRRRLRAAHGRSREFGRVTASETVPARELPPASPVVAGPSDRDERGRFVRGNGAHQRKRVRPGARGRVSSEALGLTTHQSYAAFERWGRRYAAHRRAELATLHGGELSAGVGALVESAALALAASRYLYALGAAVPLTKSRATKADFLAQAARLQAEARATERDAWAIAALEAEARRASAPASAVPWFVTTAEPSTDTDDAEDAPEGDDTDE